MFTIGLRYHFFGFPSKEELVTAINSAPQQVAPFRALHAQVAVKFIFNVIVFEMPTQEEQKEFTELIHSVWLNAVQNDVTNPLATSDFLVLASIMEMPSEKALMN